MIKKVFNKFILQVLAISSVLSFVYFSYETNSMLRLIPVLLTIITYIAFWFLGGDRIKKIISEINPHLTFLVSSSAVITYFFLEDIDIFNHLLILLTGLLSILFIDANLHYQDSTLTSESRNQSKKKSLLLSLILIVVTLMAHSFVLSKIPLHVDEAYAHLTALGYEKYNEIGATVSGVEYRRSQITSAFISYINYFFEDTKTSLRAFTVILSGFISIALFYLLIRILGNNLLSFIITLTVSTNWYFILITSISRGYALSVFLLIIFVITLKHFLDSTELRKKALWISLAIFALIINYFEGVAIGTYHAIAFLAVFAPFVFYKLSRTEKLIVLLITTTSLFFLIIYISLVDSSHLQMIKNYFKPHLRLEYIEVTGSLIYYLNEFGLVLVASSLITCISLLKKNYFYLCFAIWIITVILFQGYLYGYKTFDFRYFYTIIIPIIAISSLFLFKVIKRKGVTSKLIASLLILGMFATSLFNYTQIYQGNISWTLDKSLPWDSFLSHVPYGSVIITDYPIVVFTLRPDLKIYKISYHPRDAEIINFNLSMEYKLHSYEQKEILRIFSFINEKKVEKGYITVDQQDYDIYTASPLVMDKQHLLDIIDKSHNNVYSLFTYDVDKHKDLYPEIYSVLINEKIIKGGLVTQKNVFDNRYHDEVIPLTLIKYN